jgi:iron complex outermembrane receptor protein
MKNTAGVDTLVQRQRDVTHRETKSINMSPRFNYRFDNGDTLMFQPFLMMSRSESGVDSVVDQIYRAGLFRSSRICYRHVQRQR